MQMILSVLNIPGNGILSDVCKCVLSVLVNDYNTYQRKLTDQTFVFQYTVIYYKN